MRNRVPVRRMTEPRFWSEFGSDESSTVDFKERLPRKLQDSLVASANSGVRGTIVCGVDGARPRRIVGIARRQEQAEKVAAAARETQSPIHPSVETIEVDGHTVALIPIGPLERGWVQTSDGRPLVRAGPTNPG